MSEPSGDRNDVRLPCPFCENVHEELTNLLLHVGEPGAEHVLEAVGRWWIDHAVGLMGERRAVGCFAGMLLQRTGHAYSNYGTTIQ
jgi:hypothetical protein